MTDKKLLAFLIVCAAIMAGTVIQVTQHVSDANGNGDGNSVGMQIQTGDAVLGANANATQWTSGDTTCTLDDDGVFTVSGTGAMADYSQPSSVPWYSVKAQITSVVIDEGVTRIGTGTFSICTSLTSVTIPASVTSIGHGAFSTCTSLTSVTIPASVTSIADVAFSGCTSLTNIFFLGTSWDITVGSNAFSLGTSSASVNATVYSPNNVADGQLDAYKGDYTTLTYAPTVMIWTSGSTTCVLNLISGVFTVTGQGAMADYTSQPSPSMPWYSIREQITSVVIDEGVTHIGISAFFGCTSLKSVTIGDSVETVGDSAFMGCSSLESVIIGNSVTSIGRSAFQNCTSLTSVTIPASVTSIGQGVFAQCISLTNIFFLGTSWAVTSIGSYAFSLGTSSVPVTATVHSPNNVANGQLDAYKGSYTTLNYVASVLHTYTINVNDATYGSVSPTSVQIWDGTSVVTDGNRLIFTDGQTVTATPAQATAQYTYTFGNWTFGSLTQTANFVRDLTPHTVTFQSSDDSAGTVSPSTVTVLYGTTYSVNGNVMTFSDSQTITATPAQETTQYTYAFDSWSSASGTVEQDMTITANFTKIDNHKVTFEVNNAEFGSVQYGSLWIQEGSVPTVEGNTISFVSNAKQNTAIASQATDAYFYSFESWTGVPQQITGDVTITAQFVRADKMNVDVLAKETINIDVSQMYSGATEHHQTDYGDWISLANGHLTGTVPADLADGHYYLVWWAKESLPRADWTAYYVMLHPTDSKTIQLSQDAEQTVHSDGKVQILGRGVMSNQMARLLDPYKELVNIVDIRGLTTVQYMPAISNSYILVLGDSVTGFKDESNNHFDAVVVGGGINSFTVTGFHAYDRDGKEITGSVLRGRVLIEQRTMQYEEIAITEVDNHYHNATCYAVQGSTLDNSENDRIKFSVTGAGSIPQYILDLLAHSGQSWGVQMQSGSSFKNVTIDTEGVLQGVQSNSVGTYTGVQSAYFTNTDYGAMYSCTMQQSIAFQVFVQYKLVIN